MRNIAYVVSDYGVTYYVSVRLYGKMKNLYYLFSLFL